jgi:hypothetical protein
MKVFDNSRESKLSLECSSRFWLSAISQRDLVYQKVLKTKSTVMLRAVFQTRHTIRINSHRCDFGITQPHYVKKQNGRQKRRSHVLFNFRVSNEAIESRLCEDV